MKIIGESVKLNDYRQLGASKISLVRCEQIVKKGADEMENVNDYVTAREIAKQFGVVKRIVIGWIQQGKFPNAIKKENEMLQISCWLVPKSDLDGFVPQGRRGKPHDPQASKAAVVRRGTRSKAVAV